MGFHDGEAGYWFHYFDGEWWRKNPKYCNREPDRELDRIDREGLAAKSIYYGE
jgi:hypothetical protein